MTAELPPNLSPGSAPEPGWFARAFNFIRGVGGSVLDLAKLVLTGQASPSQIVFFAIGLLGLVCIATFPLLAIHGEMAYVVVNFVVLAVVVLVLVCLMAWRMGQSDPQTSVALEAARADLVVARTERDRATDQLTVRTSELAVTTNDLTERTKQLDTVTQLLAARTTELAALTHRSAELTNELQVAQGHVSSLTAERDESRDWLRELYARCEQIALQLHKEPKYPLVLSDVSVLTIEADGTLVVEQTVVFKAANKLQMILRELGSDAPVQSVRELQIELQAARTSEPHNVVVLPAGDLPNHKKLLFVFLPEVPVNARIEYKFCWRWPNLWRQLIETGTDTWEVIPQSKGPIETVQISFRLAPELQPRFAPLQLKNIGNSGGQAEGPRFDKNGYAVYTWVASNVQIAAPMKIVLS